MCGILGVVGAALPDRAAFARALDTLSRRGPDDRGVWTDGAAMFGHRRLSVQDLSSAGHQPMVSADGRYVIIFNGEVYNFGELRKELERDGLRLRSGTDTEVILELYAREGLRAVERFRGMFALGIWDTCERELVLVRDRLGIKPLYVFQSSAGIAFASELKALRALPGAPTEVDADALAQFLVWGSVPTPHTMLRGMFHLPPATWARWRDGKLEHGRYWHIPNGSVVHRTRGEMLEVLRAKLREAVALRCIADVPVGAFLSGGIDSSAVVSLMRSVGQRDLHTFSLSFPGTELDEARFAAEVAKQFETRHSEVPVTEGVVRASLEDFFAALDQPTCDGLNTYLVSKYAKQAGMTCALSGLGGDELFGGYPSFARAQRLAPVLEHVGGLTRSVAVGHAASRLSPRLAKLQAFQLRGEPMPQLYLASRGLFSLSQARSLLSRDVRCRARLDEALLPALEGHPSSPFHATMELELRRYMHDQLLKDSDVFGMAHALEIRLPLIDHHVVEIVASTASDVVLQPNKGLLRDALPERLPAICTERPKMGFTFPFAQWMRTSWRPQLEAVLLSGAALGGWLDPAAVAGVWGEFVAGRVHWSRPWSLYVLARYLQR